MDLYGVPLWLVAIITLILWLYWISYMGFLVFGTILLIKKFNSPK